MAQTHRFTTPNELRGFSERRSADSDEDLNIELALLLPLGDPEILAQSRDFESRYSRDQNGRKCGLTNYEYLNLTSLAKSWRKEWVPFVRKHRSSLRAVTFDASLPTYLDEAGVEKQIHWSDEGLNAHTWGFQTMTFTLATTARMLKGEGLSFKVVFDRVLHTEGYGEKLQRQLGNISK